VAGFHAAAGGLGYTTVEPGRLRRLDLSPLLAVDRAIVVGRAPPGVRGTTWEISLNRDRMEPVSLAPQAADSGTLVRIVVPLPDATPPAEEKP
jgi:hypothetical protein